MRLSLVSCQYDFLKWGLNPLKGIQSAYFKLQRQETNIFL